jgi:hypothetical protein
MILTSLKTVFTFWFLDPTSGFSQWFAVALLETLNVRSEERKKERERQCKRRKRSGK